MSTDKFQNKYRIPSARAQWHGYDGGAYFVTICTAERNYYFGKIRNGINDEPEMQLSEIGKMAAEYLQNVSAHYPYAEIPLFVVMPNHIHLIVIIDGEKYNSMNSPVETMRASSLQTTESCEQMRQQRWKSDIVNKKMQHISHKRGALSVMVGGIKSAITKFAHENNIPFAWQTRFYDRIVRNQNEMNCIADYIENNVQQWNMDCFNHINDSDNMNKY